MALDKKFIGKTYGPTVYEVGVEKLREFAYAVGGGVPSLGFTGKRPADLHPYLWDAEASKQGPYGGIVGMPNFAVVFSIGPFGQAVQDPELGINLLMLVHGEQEFEFKAPIRPGDVLTSTGVIADIFDKVGKDFLIVNTESKNQRGEVVVTGVWTAVIRRA